MIARLRQTRRRAFDKLHDPNLTPQQWLDGYLDAIDGYYAARRRSTYPEHTGAVGCGCYRCTWDDRLAWADYQLARFEEAMWGRSLSEQRPWCPVEDDCGGQAEEPDSRSHPAA